MLPKEAIAAQRRHPVASLSLLFATLSPMVIGITALGMFLKHLFCSPSILYIAVGASVLILFVPLLMCVGAACWLVVARRVIPRQIARAFFVYPGLGMLSIVSEWMFVRAYRKDDQ
jgi:hypothetical protein